MQGGGTRSTATLPVDRAEERPRWWLDVRTVPVSLRPLMVALLVVIVAWSALFVGQSAGTGVRYGRASDAFGLMGQVWGATAIRLGVVGSLIVVAVAAAGAAQADGWSQRRGARAARRGLLVGVALLGSAFVEDIAVRAGSALAAGAAADAGFFALLRAAVRAGWLEGVAWSGLTALVVLPTLPLGRPWSRRLSMLLAAAPLAAWLLVVEVEQGLGRPWLANADYRSDVLLDVVDGLELLLVLFVVWELLTWAQLATAISVVVVRPLRRGAALAALIALKALWLFLGLAGLLPVALGGVSSVWEASRTDGWASWLWGALLASGLALWVGRGRALEQRPLPVPALPTLGVLLALCAPSLVAGMLVMAGPGLVMLLPLRPLDVVPFGVVAGAAILLVRALRDDPATGVFQGLRPGLLVVNVCLLAGFLVAGPIDSLSRTLTARGGGSGWEAGAGYLLAWLAPGTVSAHFFLAPAVAFLAALLVAVGAARRRRLDPAEGARRLVSAAVLAAGLAGAAVLYTLPRLAQVPLTADEEALGATGDLLAPRFSHLVFPLRAPAWEGWWNGPAGTVELTTLDTLLTLALAVVLLRSFRRLDAARVAVLGFVLVVSTVLAHSSTLVPTGWAGQRLFYLGLVSPLVVQFLLLGRRTNEEAARRPGPAVAGLALVALLVTVLGYRVLTNDLSPAHDLEAAVLAHTRDFSAGLFLLPLGLAAAASRVRGRVR